MDFDVQRNTFVSYEGRIFLQSTVLLPRLQDTVPQKYLFDFVKACEAFSKEKLYPTLLQNFSNTDKTPRYSYEVSVDEICNSAYFASYVIKATLRRNGEIVASGIKCVSFEGDKIIPDYII